MSGVMQAGLPEPEGRLLDHGLAYVSIPALAGSPEAGTAYALGMHKILRELDTSTPCGWIVDLRQNSGGDLWPMLAGLGPLLGEGLAGAFVNPDEYIQSTTSEADLVLERAAAWLLKQERCGETGEK